LPLGSSVAVWDDRGVIIATKILFQLLEPGSYRSPKNPSEPPSDPPATSTMPLGSSVAGELNRALIRLPAGDQVLVAGSYTSALTKKALLPWPPATSTLPLLSSVAVWPCRAVVSGAAGDQVPVLES